MANTSTDWQALCAELHAAFNTYAVGEEHHQLLVRAAAALAQPEPKRPTVMEIIALADEVEAEELGQIDLVRRALARWGRPAIEPVPVEERLPGPGDCDAEGRCWLWDSYENMWDLVNLECRVRAEFPHSTHWLPYIAIPTPTREENLDA